MYELLLRSGFVPGDAERNADYLCCLPPFPIWTIIVRFEKRGHSQLLAGRADGSTRGEMAVHTASLLRCDLTPFPPMVSSIAKTTRDCGALGEGRWRVRAGGARQGPAGKGDPWGSAAGQDACADIGVWVAPLGRVVRYVSSLGCAMGVIQ